MFRSKATLRIVLTMLAVVPFATIAREVGHPDAPETLTVPSGAITLRASLWRPPGDGPFPAIFFNHGSGNTREHQAAQAERLGPLFARHGYVFMYLYRRVSGLSADAGTSEIERMNRVLAAEGQDARNRLQLQMLEGDSLDDASAGLAFLRTLHGVDAHRIALVGHSYGASLSLLMAERDDTLRAAVAFSGSTASWDRSPPLRARLVTAVDHAKMPIFLIEATNDYSIEPTKMLSAEMERLHKPYRSRIYPAVGTSADDGHGFIDLGVDTWEADVFEFLDAEMRR